MFPRVETALGSAGGLGWRGSVCVDVTLGETCIVQICCAGDEGGRCDLGWFAEMSMALHGFVSRYCASDLHNLSDNEHGDPGELEGRPCDEDDGEGIFVVGCAERVG